MEIILTKTDLEKPYFLEATNERNQTAHFDANPSIGGHQSAFSPMEHVLAALAGCSSIDVILVLRKKKLELKHFSVKAQGVRKDAVPAVFESILLTFQISDEVPEHAARRAIELSLDKYCSVATMLKPTVEISYELEQPSFNHE